MIFVSPSTSDKGGRKPVPEGERRKSPFDISDLPVRYTRGQLVVIWVLRLLLAAGALTGAVAVKDDLADVFTSTTVLLDERAQRAL